MDFTVTNYPGKRAAYISAQTQAVQAQKNTAASDSVRAQDEIVISSAAQAAGAASVDAAAGESGGAVTTFASFAEEFEKVTQGYSDTIRAYYASEHEENLTYSNPSAHIWDKYKNPESPDFRSGLSEDERAWAYDQELDLLNGGRHLQMGNPYAFPDGAPTLASAAMQANQACREQIGQSIRDLFAENGIAVPADVSFRLTVDPTSYTIRVSGLEDGELAESIEQALNAGDNGKNLYDHLKVTAPDGGTLGADYEGGHLAATDALDDASLDEVKKQTCPAYARYSDVYSPHQEPLGFMTGPGAAQPSQEYMDRSCAIVRMGAPEMLARYRAGEFGQQNLVVNKYAEVDPDGSIAAQTYVQAYAQQAADAQKAIEGYYAAAHRENSSFPFSEGVQHIEEKYKLADSPLFRADLLPRQRDMYYRQEMALLTGGPLTMLDPYALASIGGVQTVETAHEAALLAVRAKLDALLGGSGQ